ncbi:MAG: flavin reductase family protein [Dehalococcoidia bacterium]|nr:flavin reductase family protein [Dehalococcoidia bacterium]
MTSPEVHPNDFKAALGAWAAGVTVVTTKSENMVHGITASSFSSLSFDPMLVLVCVANTSRLVQMINESKRFAVSILAEGQEDVSAHFATSGREPVEKFEQFGTIEWHTGSPIIDGSLAHLDCELYSAVPGGDHTIVVGKVLGAAATPERKPLLYYRRGYRKLILDD